MDTSSLAELRPDSGRRLLDHVIHGLTALGVESALNMKLGLDKGTWQATRTPQTGTRVKAQKLIKTLSEDTDRSLTSTLNDALQGATNYPVMNAVLGTAALMFTVATTALSTTSLSQRILARDGDEIGRVEEIGKITASGKAQPTYVLAYFLVDPYRKQSPSRKGWLLHEARYPLVA